MTSASGSQSGRPRAASTSSRPQGYPPALGYDPALDPLKLSKEKMNTRVELPPEAYDEAKLRTPFARRPGFNTTGRTIRVHVNQFRIASVSAKDVYQYHVSVTPTLPRANLIMKLWETPTVQAKLSAHPKPWLFDGRSLSWSTNKVSEIKMTINVDERSGRPQNDKNTYNVLIKSAGTIRLSAIHAYLEGNMGWDNSVLDGMNFLDHVIRQGPSTKMRSIRRNFFPTDARRQDLNMVSEVVKGVYASIRMNQSIQDGGTGLGINVSVANCAFWLAQDFEQLAREFIGCYHKKWENMQYNDLVNELKPITKSPAGNNTYVMSEAFKVLRKLKRIRFTVSHRGKALDEKQYVVKSFAWNLNYGPEGGNAKNVTFERKEDDGNSRKVSIYDYFQERYGIQLQHWRLPVIETARGGFFPMEVCAIPRYNRYPFKLDAWQTQKMIKFAVQRPQQSRQDIMTSVKSLAWDTDKYLDEFGVKVSPSMQSTEARLISSPDVQFANQKVCPGTSGRWDLRGKKFIAPNTRPLKSWGFVAVDACVDKATLDNFIKVFLQTYQNHGGRVEVKPMVFIAPKGKQHHDVVEESYKQVGGATKFIPQIMFYVLKDRTSWVYDRLKKNSDCRWACLTQMLLSEHVRRAQAQYCSNVCMKVNAKLGGQTARVAPPNNTPPFFKLPTMMIGVDVSHPAHGAPTASMAAMCASMDKDAATYMAACETNGYRHEILTPANVQSMLPGIIKTWCLKNKTKPQHVFYFRDGVSEGQFAHVMECEITEIRRAFMDVIQLVPKITVIVATKRHHIRIFPEKGDKNGNPLPGTLVEREVTHPFHYDFYLCSHVALQGTARPVHYHVLHDEIKMRPDELQRMIYHQCYQYIRSTTPVSLHPAIYYAHLTGTRARSHENIPTGDQVPDFAKEFVTGKKLTTMAKRPESKPTSKRTTTESMPLLPMGGPEARVDARETFRTAMWYI